MKTIHSFTWPKTILYILTALLLICAASPIYSQNKSASLLPGEKDLLDNLATTEKKFGRRHQETQVRVVWLARFYLRNSLHSKATPYFEWALENDKQFYGPDNSWLCNPMLELASSYDFENKTAKADAIYEELLIRYPKMMAKRAKDEAELMKKPKEALTEEEAMFLEGSERPKTLSKEVESEAAGMAGAGLHREAEVLKKRAVWIRERERSLLKK